MGLSVTVLGCSGSYPGAGEACSGYLVRGGDTTLWVDAGSGTLANLQRHCRIDEVDAILLSHEHPDHWHDLDGYYVASKYYVPRERVPVYAPPGLRERPYHTGPPLDWHEVTGGDAVTIGDIGVRFSRTDHPPHTLAMRFDLDGRSVGYSADAGEGWALSELGMGLDLVLCEATLAPGQEGSFAHLTAAQAGRQAREAGAQRLVLTHLQPGLDREQVARHGAEAFRREVTVAATGEEYRV